MYADSRARYEAGQTSRWCKYTHALLQQLGMEEVWQQGPPQDMKKWDKDLREKIQEKEQKEWIERMKTQKHEKS